MLSFSQQACWQPLFSTPHTEKGCLKNLSHFKISAWEIKVAEQVCRSFFFFQNGPKIFSDHKLDDLGYLLLKRQIWNLFLVAELIANFVFLFDVDCQEYDFPDTFAVIKKQKKPCIIHYRCLLHFGKHSFLCCLCKNLICTSSFAWNLCLTFWILFGHFWSYPLQCHQRGVEISGSGGNKDFALNSSTISAWVFVSPRVTESNSFL